MGVEAEFPVDKEDLMQMVKDKKVKPILSGEKEFWEAFMCLHYDKWYEVRLVFAFFGKFRDYVLQAVSQSYTHTRIHTFIHTHMCIGSHSRPRSYISPTTNCSDMRTNKYKHTYVLTHMGAYMHTYTHHHIRAHNRRQCFI